MANYVCMYVLVRCITEMQISNILSRWHEINEIPINSKSDEFKIFKIIKFYILDCSFDWSEVLHKNFI